MLTKAMTVTALKVLTTFKVSICFIVNVSPWTMCWMGLRRMVAASEILSVGNGFKMFRPNAVAMSAAFLDMIPFKTFGRLAREKMVGQKRNAVDVNAAITLGIAIANEQHAAVRSTRINLRPETLFGGTLKGHLGLLLPGVAGGQVTLCRPFILGAF